MYDARSDIGKLKSLLPKYQKKLQYAESEALNQTANIAAKAQRAQAEQTFDRPTPFLLNGIHRPTGSLGFVGVFSRFNTLRAELIPGGPRGNFTEAGRRINAVVRLQALGGTRTPAKRALPVPTNKARKNKYGNLSRTYIKNLLGKPNHVQLGAREGLPPGIYRRGPGGVWSCWWRGSPTQGTAPGSTITGSQRAFSQITSTSSSRRRLRKRWRTSSRSAGVQAPRGFRYFQ